MSESDALAEVLMTHRYMPCAIHNATVNVWWAQCEGCDWKGPRRSNRHADEGDHRAHVVAELARLIADVEAMGEARALTATADAWQWGEWANVLLPASKNPIDNGQRVTNWLRQRAALTTGDPA